MTLFEKDLIQETSQSYKGIGSPLGQKGQEIPSFSKGLKIK